MRGWPFHSVRARLTLWYLLTLAGGLLTFALFVFVVRAHRPPQSRPSGRDQLPGVVSVDRTSASQAAR